MKENIESLAKAGKDLMLGEPFYGLLLMSLRKVWDKKVGTLGVGLNRLNYILVINPEFWEKFAAVVKKGLLKHELLHIAFFHVTDYNAPHFRNKKVLNWAMDIVVNQYIERQWLPHDGVFLDSFPDLELEPKQSTRYYYDKLMKEQEQNPKGAIAQMLAGGGSGEGNGEGTVQDPNGNDVQVPQHDWEDLVSDMDDATKKLLESQTKHIVTQVAEQVQKSRGTIPGEFEELIKRLTEVKPPKFDWRGYMRRFTGRSSKTYTKKSRRKPNKRLPDFPGLKIMQRNHILFAIDTSASVSTKELKECLAELYHIQKTGTEITVIQCDTAISHVSKFDHRKDLEIHGRGGTDFQPVIDYYNENFKRFSALMYFTDGEAPAPENAKGNILWILSSVSDLNEDLPGQKILLEL